MSNVSQCHPNHNNRLHGQVLTGSFWEPRTSNLMNSYISKCFQGFLSCGPTARSLGPMTAVQLHLSGDPGNMHCREQQHAWKTHVLLSLLAFTTVRLLTCCQCSFLRSLLVCKWEQMSKLMSWNMGAGHKTKDLFCISQQSFRDQLHPPSSKDIPTQSQ